MKNIFCGIKSSGIWYVVIWMKIFSGNSCCFFKHSELSLIFSVQKTKCQSIKSTAHKSHLISFDAEYKTLQFDIGIKLKIFRRWKSLWYCSYFFRTFALYADQKVFPFKTEKVRVSLFENQLFLMIMQKEVFYFLQKIVPCQKKLRFPMKKNNFPQ